jgi:hypothetical protein
VPDARLTSVASAGRLHSLIERFFSPPVRGEALRVDLEAPPAAKRLEANLPQLNIRAGAAISQAVPTGNYSLKTSYGLLTASADTH